jgi:hypothetical protein
MSISVRNRGNVYLVALVLALVIGMAWGQSARACCWCGWGCWGGYGYGYGCGWYGGYGGYYGGGHYGGGYYGRGLGYGRHAWAYPSYGYNLAYAGYGYPGYGYSMSYPYYGYSYGYPSYANSYPSSTTSYPTVSGPAGTVSYSSAYAAPATGPAVTPSAETGSLTSEPALGIEAQPVVEPDGQRGMRVAKVDPGTAAAQAGLQPGDVIRSANGFMTEVPGNLAWIINNAASDNRLTMNVRSAKDGSARTIVATVRK